MHGLESQGKRISPKQMPLLLYLSLREHAERHFGKIFGSEIWSTYKLHSKLENERVYSTTTQIHPIFGIISERADAQRQ